MMQSTSDEIESSALMDGPFTSRNYYKISFLPEYRYALSDDKDIIFKAGATLKDTNRNEGRISPIAEISRIKEVDSGRRDRIYLSYAESIQFIGYGAIGGSETSGLFRSNHNLSRETSRNLELGYQLEHKLWVLHATVFHRWDDDLADWTYTGTGARSAENLDLETSGVELLASRNWESFQSIISYGFLTKREDYGNLVIDGSFYALNFPKHRFTLGLIWDALDSLQVRIDNEWREQHENSLRKGPVESFYSHLAVSYYPAKLNDLELFLAYDKPWDEDFQDIPGTPGRGDQFSFGTTYSW
jgi:outer membrane receptor for ferrienterochelin and colicin